jgi:hypothetical protein
LARRFVSMMTVDARRLAHLADRHPGWGLHRGQPAGWYFS